MKKCSRLFQHLLSLALLTLITGNLNAQAVTLPPPDPGSFGTAFDFLPDGRLIAFSGFEVSTQSAQGSSIFDPLGTLPPEFLGGSDPAFVITGPAGLFFVLGTGAGGSQFPQEPFNGSLFVLGNNGGEAELIANIPYHFDATFRKPLELFVNRGEGTFQASAVERLSLITKEVQLVIDAIPGASGGVGVDQLGNLYTGIGFDNNLARTGEIRRFSRQDVDTAIDTGIPLDFDTDGTFIAQVLSATGLLFDLEGDLWIAGGDIMGGGQQGFIAEIDPNTGDILRRIDPSDGDPDSGPTVFYSIAISDPISCKIAAADFFDPTRTVYEIDACQTLPLP